MNKKTRIYQANKDKPREIKTIKKPVYVLGFLFDLTGTQVVLINKTHPEWQKGLLNGVGGEANFKELPLIAMRREFIEETGLDIVNWNQFFYLTTQEFDLYFYKAFSTNYSEVKSVTEEKVIIYNAASIHNIHVVPDLKWLIPLALSRIIAKGEIK